MAVLAFVLVGVGVSSGAPVPAHLFPRPKPDPVVPGLVFTWPGEDTRWVVRRIDVDGRAIVVREDGGDRFQDRDPDDVRRAVHHGYTTVVPVAEWRTGSGIP